MINGHSSIAGWQILTGAVIVLFTITSMQNARAAVSVDKIDYCGWKDSYKLSNGKTSVVVVPQAGGRIMEFSLDGDTPMWVNPEELGKTYPPVVGEWHNYGGYKTWPSPQSVWGWPPDPYLDQAPAVVEKTGPGSIRITGANSPNAGITFVKDLTLDSSSSRLIVSQKMINTSDKTVEWGIWDVTQVKPAGRVAFPVNPSSRFEDGVLQLYVDPNNTDKIKHWRVRDGICILEPGKFIEKIGADPSNGWMLWANEDLVYIKLFPVQKINAVYQDGGCQIELFNAPGPPAYIEMEASSPVIKLKPGEKTEFTEIWLLARTDKPVKTDEDLLKLVDNLKSRKVIK